MSDYEAFAPIYDDWSADMTEDVDFYVELEEPASLVYCPYRALLHLPTWADRRRTFEHIAAWLKPGGRFAWNAFVFDPHIAARMDGTWQDEPVRQRLDYTPSDGRTDITLEGGTQISLWWVSRSEWEGLLDVSGFETEALYGWFDRRPFGEESREFVWLARKPS